MIDLTSIVIGFLAILGAVFFGMRREQAKDDKKRRERQQLKDAARERIEVQDDEALIDLISRNKPK